MPVRSWSARRERQYDHIKSGLEKRGKSTEKAEEIAARTVNKERARAGESRDAILLGIVGGFVGGYLVSLFTHHSSSGLLFEFVIALIGAIILVAIARLIKRESIRA